MPAGAAPVVKHGERSVNIFMDTKHNVAVVAGQGAAQLLGCGTPSAPGAALVAPWRWEWLAPLYKH